MKIKINFKRTWWIFLLMGLFFLIVTFASVSIDYVLSHSQDFQELLNTSFNSKYTYQDILTIAYLSYIMSLTTALILLIWYLLFSLFFKKNKDM